MTFLRLVVQEVKMVPPHVSKHGAHHHLGSVPFPRGRFEGCGR